jgi:hypothetical protein
MSAQPAPEPSEDAVTAALPRVDSIPAPVPAEERTRVRTPLSVVPMRNPKRRRVPFVLLCVAIIAAVVGIVLSMNIKVAGTQYDLVRMNAKSQDLKQANQATQQELDYRMAPQNLSVQAKKSGMVAAGLAGVVDLDRKRVTAKGTPATKVTPTTDKFTAKTVDLDKPMSPEEQAALAAKKQAVIRAKQQAVADAAAAKTAKAAQGTKVGSDTSGTSKSSGGKATKGDNGKATSRGFTSSELNGGTIPAPRTR